MSVTGRNYIAEQLARLKHRVAQLERRYENSFRHGPVTDVDAEKQIARIMIGKAADGTPQKSPWVPYGQFAGDLKVHTPVTVGQNLTLMTPGGDMEQAVILPFTWNNDFPSPSDKQDENVITYGDVKITLKAEFILIEIGGFTLKVSAEGLAMEGGGVGHDGRDIGSTHRHEEVMPGPAETGLPVHEGPVP